MPPTRRRRVIVRGSLISRQSSAQCNWFRTTSRKSLARSRLCFGRTSASRHHARITPALAATRSLHPSRVRGSDGAAATFATAVAQRRLAHISGDEGAITSEDGERPREVEWIAAMRKPQSLGRRPALVPWKPSAGGNLPARANNSARPPSAECHGWGNPVPKPFMLTVEFDPTVACRSLAPEITRGCGEVNQGSTALR
jgi:hypothetical protein